MDALIQALVVGNGRLKANGTLAAAVLRVTIAEALISSFSYAVALFSIATFAWVTLRRASTCLLLVAKGAALRA